MADFSKVPAPLYKATNRVVELPNRDVREYRNVAGRVETRESAKARRLAVLAALDANCSLTQTGDGEVVFTDPKTADYLRQSCSPLGDGRVLFSRNCVFYRIRPDTGVCDLRIDASDVTKILNDLAN